MLRELSIKNFAIIDDLSVAFEEGFTVLTGETGAGKSIIINAVNLILGSRVSPEMIRTSEETAELEALFEVPAGSLAARAAEAQGFDLSEGLLIRRLIQKNGRHRIYVNGRSATAQMLSTINEQLATISGQHAHQNLLRADQHLLVLDQFGELMSLRKGVAKAYQEILPLIEDLADLKGRQVEQSDHRELLAFQCREIQQARIVEGEAEALEQERQRLKHARSLFETVGECVERLYGAEGAVVEHVTEIARALKGLSPIDTSLGPLAERVQDASFQLEDLANDLRDYMKGLVFDSERLEAVEQRLDMLQGLMRKYGGSIESVLAYAERAEEELRGISLLPERIAGLEEALKTSYADLGKLCRELSRERKKAAERLADKVRKELAVLDMSGTRFEVGFRACPADGPADRRDVHADPLGDIRHLERLHVGNPVIQEAALDVHELLGDPKQGGLALAYGRNQPLRAVELLLEVLLHLRVAAGLPEKIPIVGADLQSWQVF